MEAWSLLFSSANCKMIDLKGVDSLRRVLLTASQYGMQNLPMPYVFLHVAFNVLVMLTAQAQQPHALRIQFFTLKRPRKSVQPLQRSRSGIALLQFDENSVVVMGQLPQVLVST
jgi:hypothetical protein